MIELISAIFVCDLSPHMLCTSIGTHYRRLTMKPRDNYSCGSVPVSTIRPYYGFRAYAIPEYPEGARSRPPRVHTECAERLQHVLFQLRSAAQASSRSRSFRRRRQNSSTRKPLELGGLHRGELGPGGIAKPTRARSIFWCAGPAMVVWGNKRTKWTRRFDEPAQQEEQNTQGSGSYFCGK